MIERLLLEEIDAYFTINKRNPDRIILSKKAHETLYKECYTLYRQLRDAEEIAIAKKSLGHTPPSTTFTYDGIPIDVIDEDGIVVKVR